SPLEDISMGYDVPLPRSHPHLVCLSNMGLMGVCVCVSVCVYKCASVCVCVCVTHSCVVSLSYMRLLVAVVVSFISSFLVSSPRAPNSPSPSLLSYLSLLFSLIHFVSLCTKVHLSSRVWSWFLKQARYSWK